MLHPYAKFEVPIPSIPKIWPIFGHGIYPSADLLTLELECSATCGTDNLPANFGACATFLCQVTGKYASN